MERALRGKKAFWDQGVLGQIDIGKTGSLEQIGKWWREVWGNVLRCRGTGKSVEMCVEVWGQMRENVSGVV